MSFCGLSFKNTPSACGVHGVLSACSGRLTYVHRQPLIWRTWNDKYVAVLSIAVVIASAGTPRRHSKESRADAHPASETMESKVGCSFDKSPIESAEPDSIHPARKRPSVLPPFEII